MAVLNIKLLVVNARGGETCIQLSIASDRMQGRKAVMFEVPNRIQQIRITGKILNLRPQPPDLKKGFGGIRRLAGNWVVGYNGEAGESPCSWHNRVLSALFCFHSSLSPLSSPYSTHSINLLTSEEFEISVCSC